MLFFLSTLQWGINGSQSPYATDVGEIQNALPRWGTIHFTGYPLYTLLGSLFVTLLRAVGIGPAAGASLYSAVWGGLAISMLVLLAREVGVPGLLGTLSGLAVALSASMWIDASLAEIHSMSMALTVGSLLLAVRYDRVGAVSTFMWLTLVYSQGVAHQRALVFLAPALLLLVYPRLREAWQHRWPLVGIAALAPLTYLYLPIRAWQGAEWTFGAPGTWHGFWTMIADTKAERIISIPEGLGAMGERARVIVGLLDGDIPGVAIALGLLGLCTLVTTGKRRGGVALLLVALAYLSLCLVIWEGRISDALLAAKLPVVFMAGLGLGVLGAELARRSSVTKLIASSLMVVLLGWLAFRNRADVLAITRDPGALATVETVAQIHPTEDRSTTVLALWGHDYWALAYTQAYEGQLEGLDLVDHNADIASAVGRGDRLLTLERTFYQRPLAWWDERLGRAHLSAAAPGMIEVATEPRTHVGGGSGNASVDLGNGVRALDARLERRGADGVVVTIEWEAPVALELDYSVAVHLLGHDPPRGPQDVLAQADRVHPVGGWYPTSRWEAGEVVRDCYVLAIPPGTMPVGVRVGMYRRGADGGFVNSDWIYLPLNAEHKTESG